MIRALPADRRPAAVRAGAALRDLVLGEPSVPLPVPAPEPERLRTPAGPGMLGLPIVEPLNQEVWAPRPHVDGSGDQVSTLYDTGASPPSYDIDLLEQLNKEYEDRKIVPDPPKYDAETLEIAARRRVGWVHNMVDLRNKRTLEIGCGNGFEVWSLAQNLGCDAHGVDVAHYGPWDQLSGENVHFACADMSGEHPYEPDSFDRILSFTVWEHVTHPYAMLEAAYKVLKPGGLAWIRANLYAGPQASHRYRDIYFPWPHLLFTDEVVSAWDVKHGRPPIGHAWVNRLTWLHYDYYVKELGFEVMHRTFTEVPIDEEFYSRFENVLGRFPRADLRRDYVLMVLRKPTV
jgi:SAM-dependent methyltransferase